MSSAKSGGADEANPEKARGRVDDDIRLETAGYFYVCYGK